MKTVNMEIFCRTLEILILRDVKSEIIDEILDELTRQDMFDIVNILLEKSLHKKT